MRPPVDMTFHTTGAIKKTTCMLLLLSLLLVVAPAHADEIREAFPGACSGEPTMALRLPLHCALA